MSEGKEFLNEIKERMLDYDDTRNDVMTFIFENKIQDLELMTDLFISGFLWKASVRDEVLTESDIELLLGNEFDDIDFNEDLEYILEEDWSKLDLEQLLVTVCAKSDEC